MANLGDNFPSIHPPRITAVERNKLVAKREAPFAKILSDLEPFQ